MELLRNLKTKIAKMIKRLFVILTLINLIFLMSCENNQQNEKSQLPGVSVKTTQIIKGEIENTVNLNGKAVFLKKNTIISPISGYIVKIYIKFGDNVRKNDVLFEIQTKENKALENIESNAENLGIVKVSASSGGTVNELNINDNGAYVMEGGLLCSIVENKDLLIQVNVPFEYNELLKTGGKCKINLSDKTYFEGVVYQILPSVSETDQTQNILIKPITNRLIPENLNLEVEFVSTKHANSLLVSKQAVMTDEIQKKFWLMKIVNDSLAVKIPITKGIENENLVEIVSDILFENDLVISEGAYGLPDSTIVNIEK